MIFGILPHDKIRSLNQDANSATSVCLDTLRRMVSPVKKSKKSGGKGSVALLKESLQLGCVSQDCPPKKSILWEVGKVGSNHTVKFSKGTWHHTKIRERKGPSQGVLHKCEPQERNPCAPKFEHRTREETSQQERYARREAWDLSKNVHKLKNKDKATFYSLTKAWVMPAPSSTKPEEREFEVDSGASIAQA